MSERVTTEGYVRLVQFQSFGSWFLSVFLDEKITDNDDGKFQIDSAEYFIDGNPVSKQSLVCWFAMRFGLHEGMPRCRLTGNPTGYVTCDKAEFFSSEVKS